MAKLNWGMIGGGEGSQIGPAHRLGAGIDGEFAFVAGALDHRPEAAATTASIWSRSRRRTPRITKFPRPFWRRGFTCCAKSR